VKVPNPKLELAATKWRTLFNIAKFEITEVIPESFVRSIKYSMGSLRIKVTAASPDTT
jgi:hypothetical protein